MTDTPSPKRRFWQIHLSTAVIVSVVAAGLVGLNFTAWDYGGGATGIGFPMIFRYWEMDEEGELAMHLNRGLWVPDLLLALIVVALVAYVCEGYVRRHEEPFLRRLLIASGIFLVFGFFFFVWMINYGLRHK